MKELLLVFSFFVLSLAGLFGQPFNPVYVIDVTIDPVNYLIKGRSTIKFESSLSQIKINLWANQFRSKTTPYARYQVDHISNRFYFYKEEELGGYQDVKIKSDNKSIPVDFGQDQVTIEVPPNGTQQYEIEIDFTLKLPKIIEGLGYSDSLIYLKNWYPTLGYHDGKNWAPSTYYIQSTLPDAFGSHEIKIKNSADFSVARNRDQELIMSDHEALILSKGKCPELHILPKGLHPVMSSEVFKDTTLLFYILRKNDDDACSVPIKKVTAFYNHYFGAEPPLMIMDQCRKKDHGLTWLEDNLNYRWRHNHHLDSSGIVLSQVLTNYFVKLYPQTQEPRFINKMENNDPYIPNTRLVDQLRNFDSNLSSGFYFSNDNFTYFTKCCGKYTGSALFIQLQEYLGEKEFNNKLTTYLKTHINSQISFDGLIHFLSSETQTDLVEFLVNQQSVATLSNYQIDSISQTRDSTYFFLSNTGGSKPPFSMQMENILEKKTFRIDGFSGLKKVSFSNKFNTSGKTTFFIDKNKLLREYSQKNHIAIINHASDPPQWKIKDQVYSKNKTKIYPCAGYNFGDKFFAGIYLYKNNPKYFKGLFFNLLPMYSFAAKGIVGQGEVGYSWFPSRGAHQISSYVSAKSYHKFYQKKLDYRERFIKIQPAFTIDFVNRKKNLAQGIEFLPVLLWEENGQFDENGLFTGTKYQASRILRANYWYEKTSTLGDFSFEFWLEQQSYKSLFSDKNSDYGKISFILDKEFYLSPKYKFDIRFFASAFAWNTRKTSTSFDPVFTRGSIALSHQSFNDYLYDEDYVVRENQNLGLGQQVSFYQGGGFKHATGSQFQVGMSNRYAVAINLVAPFPNPKLNFLKAYFDTGVYGNPDNKPTMLYSGGLAIYIKESVRIYYPLVMSDAFANTYKARGFSWEKISFSFTLDEIFE